MAEEYITFLVAGADTTSCLFTNMVNFLCRNPLVEAKLRQQINTYIKGEEDFTDEQLKKLTYLDSIQHETLRLADPVNILLFRECQEDDVLSGVPIPKGTVINAVPLANHYNDKYYKHPH
jgi:cytochrome P450